MSDVAEDILVEMEKLLRKRWRRGISRRLFLRRWGLLRARLSRTDEYQSFRREVIERAGGNCEVVGCTRTGAVVHHRTPVARAPWRALDRGNGMFVCRDCHADAHPNLNLKR